MSERRTSSYPPVGDPDRLDSIISRGRSIRRRRQITKVGAGGGGVVMLALVAVLVLGTTGNRADNNITADDPDADPTTTTSTTILLPDEMSVTVIAGSPATILVQDPAQPVGEGTQQCVTVSVYGPTTPGESAGDPGLAGEGTACAPGLSTNGSSEVRIRQTAVPDQSSPTPTGSVTVTPTEIGCATSITRPASADVAGDAAQPGVTSFRVDAGDLPAGDYTIRVSAASGLGDGCAPEEPEFERENHARGSGMVALP